MLLRVTGYRLSRRSKRGVFYHDFPELGACENILTTFRKIRLIFAGTVIFSAAKIKINVVMLYVKLCEQTSAEQSLKET